MVMKAVSAKLTVLLLASLMLVSCGTTATPTVNPTATPTPTATATPITPQPPSQTRSITLADNGQTIELHVGERFLLNLGPGYIWTVNVADTSVVSRVVNVLVIRGAQGIYEASQPGTTTLTATGDPPCRQTTPPCGMPSRIFRIQITVR